LIWLRPIPSRTGYFRNNGRHLVPWRHETDDEMRGERPDDEHSILLIARTRGDDRLAKAASAGQSPAFRSHRVTASCMTTSPASTRSTSD
jgi:hypothetical protein